MPRTTIMSWLAALAVLAAPAVAPAQAEPAWTPYYDCIANAERVAEAMTTVVIKLGSDKQDVNPLSAALIGAAMAASKDDEIRKYDRAARKAIGKGYKAWAAQETAAGRAPPSKKELAKLALADAKARAGQTTNIMAADERCMAMIGVK